MVVDTDDYVGVADVSEKEPIAIINPDNLDTDADQLQDLPLATDGTCHADRSLSHSHPRGLDPMQRPTADEATR